MLLVGAVSAAAGASVTRYYFPKVEFRNVEVTKEVVKNDIRTVIKEVVRPSGEREIVTETIDRSIKRESASVETVVTAKPQWFFDFGVRRPPAELDAVYDFQVHRRILGPFFVGARASTDRTVGVSIGIEY